MSDHKLTKLMGRSKFWVATYNDRTYGVRSVDDKDRQCTRIRVLISKILNVPLSKLKVDLFDPTVKGYMNEHLVVPISITVDGESVISPCEIRLDAIDMVDTV